MPIYDYTCSACNRVTEVIHGINDHGPRFCPSCGAEGTMRKALTAPAIVFKGSGWAKLDRRSTSGGSSSAKGSTKAGSTKGGGGAGTPATGAASGSGSSDASGGSGGTASSGDGGGD